MVNRDLKKKSIRVYKLRSKKTPKIFFRLAFHLTDPRLKSRRDTGEEVRSQRSGHFTCITNGWGIPKTFRI